MLNECDMKILADATFATYLQRRYGELQTVSGKTIEELIQLFRDGRVSIKEPLFEVGDKFQFKNITIQLEEDNGMYFGEVKLYDTFGTIIEITEEYKYVVKFSYGELVRLFHEDYLKGLEKVN